MTRARHAEAQRRFRDAFLLLGAYCGFTTLVDLTVHPRGDAWVALRLAGTALLLALLTAWAVFTIRSRRGSPAQR